MATAKVNYTEEMTARAIEMYTEARAAGASNPANVAVIAAELGRTTRSVISKLAREKAYVTEVKVKTTKVDTGPTKSALLATLASTGFDVTGMEGATKAVIERVISDYT